ncbi:MAG: InlB B-repeat-containing protein, partial [Christensenellales bacterium]
TIIASLNDKENYVWSDGTTADKTYEWKICRVTLSSDGENSSLEAYVLGTPLASPYKDGYTFEGWYLTPDYSGERVLSLSSIDDDTTLYAKWKKVETASSDGSDKASVLSEKAIIGIALGGGAFVLALLIVILGVIMKRGSGFGKKGPRNPHDIM